MVARLPWTLIRMRRKATSSGGLRVEPAFSSRWSCPSHRVSLGKVKWLLDIYLECDGPTATTEDDEGYSGYGITAPLEHELLLRALDGLNVRS